MNRIGIFSGNGKLPLLIGKSLLRKKYEIFFLGIKNHTNSKLYKNYNYKEISLTSFSKIIQYLKNEKINFIIMAGNIMRPSIKDIKFDFYTLSIIKNYFLESKGDDQLLKIISDFFLKKGFPLFNWTKECVDLFSTEEFLTKIKPSIKALLNKDKGLEIFNKIGKSDIGQSLIIQNQLVLGIEAAEGTDELINRCYKYKKKGDNGILIKLSKHKQSSFLDIPAIGMTTVKNIYKNNYEGIFLEKNKCLIIEKKKVIDYCNKKNLFISTIKKN